MIYYPYELFWIFAAVSTALAAFIWYLQKKTNQLRSINETLKDEVQERKRAEKVAEHFRVDAEKNSRIKDEFLATLSHELRTPANVILGFSEILENPELTAKEIIEAAEAIHRNAKKQAELIDQLLDLSRMINRKMLLKSEPTVLSQIVTAVKDTARAQIKSKQINLKTVMPAEPMVIWADPQRLRQLLWNLVANALKFTPQGGTITIAVHKVGESYVELKVSDTGEGISPEYVPHLFEKFTQQDNSATRKHGGLGLGLAIVKHLAELHGGSVSASSEGRGLGTTVSVKFPLYRKETMTPQKNLTNTRILVVDDSPDALVLASAILKRYGAEVTTAASAAEAMERLKDFQPDIVLSDISMPDEDGYTLIRRIRQLDHDWARTIPAAALTAFSGEEDRRAAIRAGFQMHIPKPIDSRKLIEGVQALREKSSFARASSN